MKIARFFDGLRIEGPTVGQKFRHARDHAIGRLPFISPANQPAHFMSQAGKFTREFVQQEAKRLLDAGGFALDIARIDPGAIPVGLQSLVRRIVERDIPTSRVDALMKAFARKQNIADKVHREARWSVRKDPGAIQQKIVDAMVTMLNREQDSPVIHQPDASGTTPHLLLGNGSEKIKDLSKKSVVDAHDVPEPKDVPPIRAAQKAEVGTTPPSHKWLLSQVPFHERLSRGGATRTKQERRESAVNLLFARFRRELSLPREQRPMLKSLSTNYAMHAEAVNKLTREEQMELYPHIDPGWRARIGNPLWIVADARREATAIIDWFYGEKREPIVDSTLDKALRENDLETARTELERGLTPITRQGRIIRQRTIKDLWRNAVDNGRKDVQIAILTLTDPRVAPALAPRPSAWEASVPTRYGSALEWLAKAKTNVKTGETVLHRGLRHHGISGEMKRYLKQFDYYTQTKQRGEIKNNNGRFDFQGQPGLKVFCRHIAFDYLKQLKAGKVDYTRYSDAKNIEKLPVSLEEEYDALRHRPTKTYLFDITRPGEWGRVLSECYEDMEKQGATAVHYLFNSTIHAMVLDQQSKNDDGQKYYAHRLFDPNASTTAKRATLLTLDSVRRAKAEDSFRSPRSFEQYFKDNIVALSVAHTVFKSKTAPVTTQNNRELICSDEILCSPGGVFHLITSNWSERLADLRKFLPNMEPRQAAAVLSAKNSVGIPALHIGMAKGITSTVLEHCETILSCPRGLASSEEIMEFLNSRIANGSTALYTGIHEGRTDTVRAYCKKILASAALSPDQKAQAIAGTSPPWHALAAGFDKDRAETIQAYCEVVLETPHLSFKHKDDLLRIKTPTLSKAMKEGKTSIVDAYCKAVLGSKTLTPEQKKTLLLGEFNGEPAVCRGRRYERKLTVDAYWKAIGDKQYGLPKDIRLELLEAGR